MKEHSVNKKFLISLVVNPRNQENIDEYIDQCASVGATDVTLFFPKRSSYTVKNGMVFSFENFILTHKKAKLRGEKHGVKVDSNYQFDFLLEENLTIFILLICYWISYKCTELVGVRTCLH